MLFTGKDMAVSILIGSGIVKQVFTTQAFYFDRMAGPSGTELGGTRPPSSYDVGAERCSVTTEHCCVATFVFLSPQGFKIICL